MTSLAFLSDLSVVLVVSAVVTLVFHRLKLPLIFGYILAGVIIGPHTPVSLVPQTESVHTLADLGLLFLMFSLGLEIRLKQLKDIGWTAGLATVLEVLLMTWVGYMAGRFLGWNHLASVFLGGTLSISSTMLITRILKESRQWETPHAKLILGILVMEDALAVVMIAALSGLVSANGLAWRDVMVAGLKVGGFMVGVLAIGRTVLPGILARLERTQSSELLLAAVLGMCFGISALGMSFGFSIALGAFLSGLILSDWKGSQPLALLIHPFRDFFAPLFFVAVGMLIPVGEVFRLAGPILVLAAVLSLGKISSVTLGTFLAGVKPAVAFQVGCGLATIGEFSFVIAKLGVTSRVMPPETYTLVVVVSLGTSLVVSALTTRTASLTARFRATWPSRGLKFLHLYHEWVQAIKWPSWRLTWVKVVQARFLPLLGSTAALVGVLTLFPYGEQWLAQWESGIGRTILRTVFWVASGLVLILPLLTWWEVIRAIGESLHLSANDFVIRAIQFIVTVFACMLLLVVGSPFVAPWPLLVVVGSVLGVAGYLLWNSMVQVEAKIEEHIREWFSSPGVSDRARQDLVAAVQHRYPWTVEFQDVMLSLEWPVGVFSLGSLKLMETTGTTVLAIFREKEELINPSPATPLTPGDVLLVVGERAQIRAAMQYLEGCVRQASAGTAPPGPEVPGALRVAPLPGESWGMDVVWVGEDSAWKGRSLQALVKEIGEAVKVIGVLREGVSQARTTGNETMESGDRWVVVGELGNIERAKRVVETKQVVSHDDEWLYRRVFDQR